MLKKEIKIKPVAEPPNIPLDVFQRNIGGKVEAGSAFATGCKYFDLLIFLQTLTAPLTDNL